MIEPVMVRNLRRELFEFLGGGFIVGGQRNRHAPFFSSQFRP
jgi:hypothetical protein